MGDAVPGLLVYSSLQRPLIWSDAVGACKPAQLHACHECLPAARQPWPLQHAGAVRLLFYDCGRALTPPPASSVFTASSNAACWSGGSPPDPRPLTPCRASRTAASAACASTLLLLPAATMRTPRCRPVPADDWCRCAGASYCLCVHALNGARLPVRRVVSCSRADCCGCAVASMSWL
jgi:hypothetical protein